MDEYFLSVFYINSSFFEKLTSQSYLLEVFKSIKESQVTKRPWNTPGKFRALPGVVDI